MCFCTKPTSNKCHRLADREKRGGGQERRANGIRGQSFGDSAVCKVFFLTTGGTMNDCAQTSPLSVSSHLTVGMLEQHMKKLSICRANGLGKSWFSSVMLNMVGCVVGGRSLSQSLNDDTDQFDSWSLLASLGHELVQGIRQARHHLLLTSLSRLHGGRKSRPTSSLRPSRSPHKPSTERPDPAPFFVVFDRGRPPLPELESYRDGLRTKGVMSTPSG